MRIENSRATPPVQLAQTTNPTKTIAAPKTTDVIASAQVGVGTLIALAGKDSSESLVKGTKNAVGGVFKNIAEAFSDFAKALASFFSGKFIDGLKQLGIGLLKLFVQTPIDALLMAGGSAISAIQTAIGLEAKGRELNSAEKDYLRKIFGVSVNLDSVRLKFGSAGVASTNNRPFVLGDTIYFKDADPKDPKYPALLAHEMTHVWQHQNGGTDYLSEALVSQWRGKAYNIEGSVPQTPWQQLEPEQQATLIEEAAKQGYFLRQPVRIGGKDVTSYVDRAVAQLRAGKGAP
ncbi:MAG: DUF4157 domain-containing protein [Deltaproteobacteria bacterium]|nr:DUF4157 domain-containing protein [Deltaproteobacteria bacterium]